MEKPLKWAILFFFNLNSASVENCSRKKLKITKVLFITLQSYALDKPIFMIILAGQSLVKSPEIHEIGSIPGFVLSLVHPVQGLSCLGFVQSKACPVQDLSCPGFVFKGTVGNFSRLIDDANKYLCCHGNLLKTLQVVWSLARLCSLKKSSTCQTC
jgi:hypothetical protein